MTDTKLIYVLLFTIIFSYFTTIHTLHYSLEFFS